MAKTITQRIALAGGEELRAAMKAIGDVGAQAFGKVQDAAAQATTVASRIAPVVDVIQKKMKDLKSAASEVHEQYNKTSDAITHTAERVAILGGAVIGAVGGFLELERRNAETVSGLAKTAQALDLTTEQLQRLQYVAKLSDVEFDQLSRVMIRINAVVAEQQKKDYALAQSKNDLFRAVLNGKMTFAAYLDQVKEMNIRNSESADIFTRLGVSFTKYSGGPLVDGHEKLLRIADAFAKATEAERALLLTEAGLTRTPKFVEALSKGRTGILALEKEAERVAPSLNKFEIKLNVELAEAFARVEASATSLSKRLLTLFAPQTTAILDAFTDAIIHNRNALFAYVSGIALQLQPITEDIVKLLNGEEVDPASIVGRWAAAVKTFVLDMLEAGKIVVGAWEVIVAVLDPIARIINRIFGTELSGQALVIAAAFAAFTGVLGSVFAALGLVFTVVGALVGAFGGVEIAIAAVGAIAGYWLGQKFLELLEELKKGWQGWAEYLPGVWASAVASVTGAWDTGVNFLIGKWEAFKNLVLGGVDAIKSAFSSIASKIGFGSGSGDSAQGYAGGGPIRGPGTGTSDSVPLWGSNGEFMMRTKAVQHYGVAFMDRLNKLQLPRFSMGGLVNGLASSMSSIVPRSRYADGGLITAGIAPGVGGRPVYVQIGDHTFGPLTAGESTVTSLERFSANRQARSAGRKPTWAGGK